MSCLPVFRWACSLSRVRPARHRRTGEFAAPDRSRRHFIPNTVTSALPLRKPLVSYQNSILRMLRLPTPRRSITRLSPPCGMFWRIVDPVRRAVVVGDDHVLHVQRRVGDLELDPAEIVERTLDDDRVVVRRVVGVRLPDEPPFPRAASSGLHHLLRLRRTPAIPTQSTARRPSPSSTSAAVAAAWRPRHSSSMPSTSSHALP